MKWAKITSNKFPVIVQSDVEDCESGDSRGDFNSPVYDYVPQSNEMTEAVCTEIDADAQDVLDVERRLADENDRVIPFKASH